MRASDEYLDYVTTMGQVLHISIHGMRAIVDISDRLSFADDALKHQEERTGTPSNYELAQRQISSNFAFLHGQASVSLWNGLESLVKDTVSDWLLNRPEIMRQMPWLKLKVPIGEFESLDADQRASYLVELVDQNVAGPLKQGVGRFEELLETIGLKGSVAEDVRDRLFELQQVRNVIVHRKSVADQKICRSCPWLNLKPGDPVQVRAETYTRYRHAAYRYTMELMSRIAEAFGDTKLRTNFDAIVFDDHE
jgi:hypothetical protein